MGDTGITQSFPIRSASLEHLGQEPIRYEQIISCPPAFRSHEPRSPASVADGSLLRQEAVSLNHQNTGGLEIEAEDFHASPRVLISASCLRPFEETRPLSPSFDFELMRRVLDAKNAKSRVLDALNPAF